MREHSVADLIGGAEPLDPQEIARAPVVEAVAGLRGLGDPADDAVIADTRGLHLTGEGPGQSGFGNHREANGPVGIEGLLEPAADKGHEPGAKQRYEHVAGAERNSPGGGDDDRQGNARCRHQQIENEAGDSTQVERVPGSPEGDGRQQHCSEYRRRIPQMARMEDGKSSSNGGRGQAPRREPEESCVFRAPALPPKRASSIASANSRHTARSIVPMSSANGAYCADGHPVTANAARNDPNKTTAIAIAF